MYAQVGVITEATHLDTLTVEDEAAVRVKRDGDDAYDPAEYGCAWATVTVNES